MLTTLFAAGVSMCGLALLALVDFHFLTMRDGPEIGDFWLGNAVVFPWIMPPKDLVFIDWIGDLYWRWNRRRVFLEQQNFTLWSRAADAFAENSANGLHHLVPTTEVDLDQECSCTTDAPAVMFVCNSELCPLMPATLRHTKNGPFRGLFTAGYWTEKVEALVLL
ncbi:hypothetical protein U1Q18_026817 [Sarracenia purpurea var. burkii]